MNISLLDQQFSQTQKEKYILKISEKNYVKYLFRYLK